MNLHISILMLTALTLFAETIILKEGKTYDFAEKNAIEDIQDHIRDNKSKIEAKISKLSIEQESKIHKWKPEQIELMPSTKERIFYPDMTYTVPNDIKDSRGRIMYKKGFKFNPGNYVKMQEQLIVINAKRKEELEWAKENKYLDSAKYMILLSDGNAFKITKEFKKPAYYLTKDMAIKFNLSKTPSIVRQVENKIQVREVCLKNCQ